MITEVIENEEILPTVEPTEEITESADAPSTIDGQEARVYAESIQTEKEETDYEALMFSDVQVLKGKFPELREMENLTELNNPLRYAYLRDLGLTPEEAYLATARPRSSVNNRAHLFGAAPKRASSPSSAITEGELANCRELFDGMSDDDIRSLYRKVTK